MYGFFKFLKFYIRYLFEKRKNRKREIENKKSSCIIEIVSEIYTSDEEGQLYVLFFYICRLLTRRKE